MLAADFLEANYDQVIWKTSNSKEKFSWIHIFFENNSSPPPLVKYPFPSLLGMLALDFSLGKVKIIFKTYRPNLFFLIRKRQPLTALFV